MGTREGKPKGTLAWSCGKSWAVEVPDTCMCKSICIMVSIWVVLGVVVGQVLRSRIPVLTELVLGSTATEPPYTHIHHFAPSGNNCVVGHPSCRGVVRLDRAFRLGPAHVDQGLTMRYHLTCCYEESSQFIFGCRRHDKFDDLGYRRIVPLKRGYGSSSERKMCAPGRLRDLDSFK